MRDLAAAHIRVVLDKLGGIEVMHLSRRQRVTPFVSTADVKQLRVDSLRGSLRAVAAAAAGVTAARDASLPLCACRSAR